MGFPTKNDHLGVFWGYHHLRKHPYIFTDPWKTRFDEVMIDIYTYHGFDSTPLKKMLSPKMGSSFPKFGMKIPKICELPPSRYMGGSKNRDTPKWMIYNGKPY